MLTCESALMAKVCEMIVNRDYIRENNAGHPPRASHRTYVSSARAGIYAPRARTWVYTRVCMRVQHAYVCARVCVCGRDAFTHVCGKKRPGGRGRAGGRARAGGRRYFFTRNERVQGETCIRLAGGSRGGGGRPWDEDERRGRLGGAEEVAEGGAGGPPFAVDFSGLFFTGDGPRLPG